MGYFAKIALFSLALTVTACGDGSSGARGAAGTGGSSGSGGGVGAAGGIVCP